MQDIVDATWFITVAGRSKLDRAERLITIGGNVARKRSRHVVRRMPTIETYGRENLAKFLHPVALAAAVNYDNLASLRLMDKACCETTFSSRTAAFGMNLDCSPCQH